jgi:hypothetical protein
LISELRRIARKLGRTPTTADIFILRKQDDVYPLYVYYAVFGSFLDAIKQARLKSRYKQEFDEADRERLLEELRALRRKLKRPLFDEDVDEARRRKEVSSPYNFVLAFGSVPRAIEAAGAAKKVYSREELIKILRKLDDGLDRPVEKKDIQKLYDSGRGPSLKRILKEFGTLSKARRAAAIQKVYRKANESTTCWQKYTKEELIAQLQALGEKLGRKPTDRDINAACKLGECASHSTFSSMFGSLAAAYRAAGFLEVAKNQRRHTDEEIIAALKRLTKEHGRFPGYHDIRKASLDGKSPAPGTVVRRIGKLTDIRSRFEM